jgi:hypothetical protein
MFVISFEWMIGQRTYNCDRRKHSKITTAFFLWDDDHTFSRWSKKRAQKSLYGQSLDSKPKWMEDTCVGRQKIPCCQRNKEHIFWLLTGHQAANRYYKVQIEFLYHQHETSDLNGSVGSIADLKPKGPGFEPRISQGFFLM